MPQATVAPQQCACLFRSLKVNSTAQQHAALAARLAVRPALSPVGAGRLRFAHVARRRRDRRWGWARGLRGGSGRRAGRRPDAARDAAARHGRRNVVQPVDWRRRQGPPRAGDRRDGRADGHGARAAAPRAWPLSRRAPAAAPARRPPLPVPHRAPCRRRWPTRPPSTSGC